MSKEDEELYRLWGKQRDEVRRRGHKKGEMWLMCPDDGTQILLWNYPGDERRRIFNVIPGGTREFKVRGWITPSEQGIMENGECISDPIPPYAADALRRALPCPPLDSFFGYYQDGKLTTIYYTHEGAQTDERVCVTQFVLQGASPPDLKAKSRTGSVFYTPVKWWPAVDKGKLRIINRELHDARHEVLAGLSHGGRFDYMIVSDKDVTGVEGQMFYSYPGTDMALKKFILRRKSIIRAKLAFDVRKDI